MSAIHEGQVHANGVDFTYLEAGAGPLALCLHGFPDTAWGWEHLLLALAEAGFRAVAPFMRGYGPTGPAPDGRYQTGVLALDAVALHEALDGGEDAILVGHDWGALGAYGAAAHAPERWRRIVAASVPPVSITGMAMLDYDLLKTRFWYQFFFCNPLSDLVVPMNDLAFIERLWTDWSPGFDGTGAVEKVREALRAPENLSAALLYYRHTLGGLDNDPALADIQALTFTTPPQPTLYLHGTDDGCMPCPDQPVLDATFIVEGSKCVLVPDAGHFLHYERPDLVNGLIVAFVTD